jgi:hypothetical protein
MAALQKLRVDFGIPERSDRLTPVVTAVGSDWANHEVGDCIFERLDNTGEKFAPVLRLEETLVN